MTSNGTFVSTENDAVYSALQSAMMFATENLRTSLDASECCSAVGVIKQLAVAMDVLQSQRKQERVRTRREERREWLATTQRHASGVPYDEVLDAVAAIGEIRERTPSAQTYTHARLNQLSDLLGQFMPDLPPAAAAPQDPEVDVVNADLRGEAAASVPPDSDLSVFDGFLPPGPPRVVVGVTNAQGMLYWTAAGEYPRGGFSTVRQRLIDFASSPAAVAMCGEAR